VEVIESSWDTFGQQIKELRARLSCVSSKPFLFRGQKNSEWPLETTLERNGEKLMSFLAYYRLIAKIGPALEAFTGESVPEYDRELLRNFGDPDLQSSPDRFPSGSLYKYMAYLRHHRFPSPLLDYSRSPYVAAYFAFSEANSEQPVHTSPRAIYAYCEAEVTGGNRGEPRVRILGPYVRGHSRHFRQQSTYTICDTFDDHNNQWRFDSHERVFKEGRQQGLLWRFDFSSAERPNILRSLDEHNLNAFSLFDSEEALLDTLWLREHVLSA
jgi:hypothetical protein